jgi:hypothetical protein
MVLQLPGAIPPRNFQRIRKTLDVYLVFSASSAQPQRPETPSTLAMEPSAQGRPKSVSVFGSVVSVSMSSPQIQRLLAASHFGT